MSRSDSTGAAATSRRRTLAAIAVGNCIEWYDFAAYAYLATEIGKTFFPGGDPTTALLSTFAVLAAAFLVRPLGGFVFGPLGDRIGRRKVLALVVILMALSTFGIGLLPGYATIGVAAPVLLILLRCVQGLSAGGEYGGAASYLAEYAEPQKRARYLSAVPATSFGGLLVASLLILALRAWIPAAQFQAWGWRIPFLIALPLGVIGLYIRSRLEESPEFTRLQRTDTVAANPLRQTLARDRVAMLQVIGIVATIGIGTYSITTYLTVYLSAEVGMDRSTALWITTAIIVLFMALVLVAGRYADRVGRRPLVTIGAAALAVLAYPMFLLISMGVAASALLAGLVLAAAFAVFQAGAVPTITELFETSRRYSGFSVSYNISIAVFGGTSSYVATYLIAATGNRLAPAWLLAAGAVLSLVAGWFAPETAPIRQLAAATTDDPAPAGAT